MLILALVAPSENVYFTLRRTLDTLTKQSSELVLYYQTTLGQAQGKNTRSKTRTSDMHVDCNDYTPETMISPKDAMERRRKGWTACRIPFDGRERKSFKYRPLQFCSNHTFPNGSSD